MGELTGAWLGDDYAIYYLTDDGETVWWAGLSIDGIENGLSFCNVFRGARSGDSLSGEWSDVPRGSTLNNGTIALNIKRDAIGDAVWLTVASATGGFSGTTWQRLGQLPGPANIATLFAAARRNGDNSLADKLDLYREPVVVFGRVTHYEEKRPVTVNWSPKAGRTYKDMICASEPWWEFWNPWPPDGDINFDITTDRQQLDIQNFWSGNRWIRNPDDIRGNMDNGKHPSDLHCEAVMFARDAKCSQLKHRPGHAQLQGWAEQRGNSVLINGRPIEGNITMGQKLGGEAPYEVLSIGGQSFSLGTEVRITGALCVDTGHSRNEPVEIHPVYAIDVIAPTPQDDLSGVWADDAGTTYYLRQMDSTVWWLALDHSRQRYVSAVLRGINQGGRLVGGCQSVPLGATSFAATIDLQLDETKLWLLPTGGGISDVGVPAASVRKVTLTTARAP